jgi:stress-induced morphogen
MNKQIHALRIKLASLTDAKKMHALKLKIKQLEQTKK